METLPGEAWFKFVWRCCSRRPGAEVLPDEVWVDVGVEALPPLSDKAWSYIDRG